MVNNDGCGSFMVHFFLCVYTDPWKSLHIRNRVIHLLLQAGTHAGKETWMMNLYHSYSIVALYLLLLYALYMQ